MITSYNNPLFLRRNVQFEEQGLKNLNIYFLQETFPLSLSLPKREVVSIDVLSLSCTFSRVERNFENKCKRGWIFEEKESVGRRGGR